MTILTTPIQILLYICNSQVLFAMEITQLLGYFCALLIGVTLGVISGGGSILAVPILAYLFHVDEKLATAYSLFIVGTSALAGGIRQHFKGYVDWRTAVVFGIPAIIGVAVVRYFVVPRLPDILFTVGSLEFTRRMGMFGLFAVLMIPAAFSMLKERKDNSIAKTAVKYNYLLILLEGLLIGAVTGLIGAGGGFLVVPALVILAKMRMKVAVGTTLVIIAFKSLIGFFIGDAFYLNINWQFLFSFTIISLVGIFIGTYLGNFINGKRLKKGFAYFIFVMAVFIFYMEFL